jgi:UDP-sugar transporter A1/2/3
MLNRALSRMQWAAIVLLSVGVGIVQLASSSADKAHHPHTPDTAVHEHLFLNNSTSDPLLGARNHVIVARDAVVAAATEHVEMNQMLGLLAVVLACMSSGFSGVFFERQLKKAPTPIIPTSPDLGKSSASDEHSLSPSSYSSLIQPSPPSIATVRKTGLWIRNIQLSLFSLLVGSSIYALTSSQTDIANFLIGFTPLVWFVVFVQIVGGLVAAVVIQYADNIAKSFSASCSIILSFAVSIAFFDFQLSTGVVVGSTAVMVATWLFSEFFFFRSFFLPSLSESLRCLRFVLSFIAYRCIRS